MSHDHPQHENTGHLVFPTGGIVSGNSGGGPVTIPDDVPAFPMPGGGTVEIVPGTIEGAAAAWNARHGRQYEDDPPEGARMMPSGHWVTIRDPKALTRGDKRKLLRDGQPVEGQSAAERIMTVQDLMHQMLITGWSYPYPLPSQDLSSLDRLPLEDDDALDDLITEANSLLFPKPASPDQHADPDSPTAPSGE